MTHQEAPDLFETFRERVRANAVLADLSDAYLHAVSVARPTQMADELRTIAKDFVPLRTNQVHPLWMVWRQVLRDLGDQVAAPAPAPAPAPVATSHPSPVDTQTGTPDGAPPEVVAATSARLVGRASENPELADLSPDYLRAVARAHPTVMADELRVVAKQFTPLRPKQVHQLWLLWREIVREVEQDPPTPVPTTTASAVPPRTPDAAPAPTAPPADAPVPVASAWSATRSDPPAPAGAPPVDDLLPPPAPPAAADPASAPPVTPPVAPAPTPTPAPRVAGADGFPERPWTDPDRDGFHPDIDLERAGVPLSAVVHRDRARLQWNAVDTPDSERAVYLVVGGRTAPRGPLQGDAVELTTATGASVDPAAGPFFAVYAYTGATLAAATASRAVRVGTGVAIADVSDIERQIDPGAIRLQWTRPATASEVRVYRNEGAPVPDDYLVPYRLETDPAADVVTDTDVAPGRRYFYLLVAANADGFAAPGAEVEVLVPVRPRAVEDLTVTTRILDDVTVVDLSWTPAPHNAEVRIHARPEPLQGRLRRDEVGVDELEALDLGARALGRPVLQGDRMVLDRAPFPENQTQQFYTPVTVAGGRAVVGRSVSASRVFAVRNVEVVDRVDWQLVRFDWPDGAAYVDLATAHTGGDPLWSSSKRVLPDRYDRDGGALFGVHESLAQHAHDIVIRGVANYGGTSTPGPETRVHYPGRWPLAYRFVRHDGGPTVLEVMSQSTEAGFVSPAVRVRAFGHPHLMPLAPGQPGVVGLPIRRDGAAQRVIEVPPGALPAHVEVRVGEIDLPPGGFVRVLVDPVSQDDPLVVLDPPAPGTLPSGRRRQERLAPGQFRCRQCLNVQDRHPQVFECVNRSCSGREGTNPFRFAIPVQTPPPPTPEPARRGGPPLRGRQAAPPVPPPVVYPRFPCPECGQESDREICKAADCLAPVRSDWFDLEPLPLVMAGAKTTGKSVFAYVALQQLDSRVGRDFGAAVAPYDADTATRVASLREQFRGGGVPVSTQGTSGYEPFAVGVSRREDGGRPRGLAVYDLSGDWVQDREQCANYVHQLTRSGGIVYLADVTQIPEVATFLRGRLDILDAADMQNPVESLQNIVAVIRRGLNLGVDQDIPVPIAVAVSKLDALHYLVNDASGGRGPDAALSIRQGYALTRDPYGGDTPTGLYDPSDGWWVHQEVRSLLVTLGVGDLLRVVESNFTHHRYFAVSALGHQPPAFGGVKGFAPFRVDEPFRWLLAEQW